MRAATENDAIPVTFYRPNNHINPPKMRLPKDVQLSTAATTAQRLTESLMHRIHLHPLSQSPGHLP
jgi:biotin synthase